MNDIDRPKLLKRGGANNRGDRLSWQLTKRDCEKILAVSNAAWAAGRPMNRFITIAWGKSGVDAQDSVKATGQFVKRARDWLGGHGYLMPWCWVQEYGDTFGQHCHMLAHVDPVLDDLFRPMPTRWVKSILPGPYEAKTQQCQKLACARSADRHPDAYHAQIMGKLHYMLKTAPDVLEAPLGMVGWGRKAWGQSCPVYGKRAAIWQGGGSNLKGGAADGGPNPLHYR